MKNFFYVFFLFVICSCVASKGRYGSLPIIPDDFELKNSTLLVERIPGEQKENEKIAELLKEKYTYPYEIAPLEDIQNPSGKYKDSVLYRFAILKTTTTTYQMVNGQRMPRDMFLDFHIYDRVAQKHYAATRVPSQFPRVPFKKLLDLIVKDIEEKSK